MYKSSTYILLGLFILFGLAGCASTTIEQGDAELQLQTREAQIANLTSALEKERQEKQRLLEALVKREGKIKELILALQKEKERKIKPVSLESKEYYFFVIAVQTALKESGFKPGLIDGKMGERTRTALKGFQKANGLPADGKINKQTWNLLRQYL